MWDFFSHSPEATHQFTWLFGDRGIPASYRRMDGFGSHTFQWVNAKGERFCVKFHFKTESGHQDLHLRRSGDRRRPGSVLLPQGSLRRDREGRLPVLDAEGAGDAGGRSGDVPHRPVRPHQGVELPGLSADSDRQADAEPDCRTTSSRKSSRPRSIRRTSSPASGRRPIACCRRGCSATATRTAIASASTTRVLAVNEPEGRGRRRAELRPRRCDALRPPNSGRVKNYEPNSFDGPVQTNEEQYAGLAVTGVTRPLSAGAARGGRLQAGRRSLPPAADGRTAAARRQHRRAASRRSRERTSSSDRSSTSARPMRTSAVGSRKASPRAAARRSRERRR